MRLDREKDIKDKALGITREINTFGLNWEKGIKKDRALGLIRELQTFSINSWILLDCTG